MDLLANPIIRALIAQAWRDSQAEDPAHRHEEGGYIVLNSDLSLDVERWTRGQGSQILPPSLDANNCYNGKSVLATFHTHPNPPIDETGREWEQGPSESDRRWHRKRKLRGLVISAELVFEIDENAGVSIIGKLIP